MKKILNAVLEISLKYWFAFDLLFLVYSSLKARGHHKIHITRYLYTIDWYIKSMIVMECCIYAQPPKVFTFASSDSPGGILSNGPTFLFTRSFLHQKVEPYAINNQRWMVFLDFKNLLFNLGYIDSTKDWISVI